MEAYAALIPEEWPVRAGAKRLVVRRETATYDQCLPRAAELPADWQPVLDSFKAENATVRFVLPDRQIGHSYVVAQTKQIRSIFGNRPPGDWSGFYGRYPDSRGYIAMSAVGFDGPKTRCTLLNTAAELAAAARTISLKRSIGFGEGRTS